MFTVVNRVLAHGRLRKYTSLVREDLAATYSRDLHKWLLIAPIVGVVTGLVITAIAAIILKVIWPPLLSTYLRHHGAILPGLVAGFVVTGFIMQFLTPNPDEHSTEEVIRSYHEHQGDIGMRAFLPKLLAAVTTVGCGGSAALEGPSIYGGGALGSWMWTRLRRFGLEPHDRRILLISGAAAGMAAVFRAPLTGLVFALEMPYKDDLAHEALLPSLIASVVSYVTLISFIGSGTLFDFEGGSSFSRQDLLWSALLGFGSGLVAMVFDITYRRFRAFSIRLPISHWLKLAVGGLLTGLCGLAFVSIFNGTLIPLGPNYEAVGDILLKPHLTTELIFFAACKLGATLFSLGTGGVSAMFVPLFLAGGALGKAFGQSVVRSPSLDLYAAVGMAAFIAAGYKTPLTAVVFVAEATGGHSYIIPTLIGAAVAYAVSGEASVSADQRLHEAAKIQELRRIPVQEVMQKAIVSAVASSTVEEFVNMVRSQHRHQVYPVLDKRQLLGTVSIWSLSNLERGRWAHTSVRDLTESSWVQIPPDCDVTEALRLLMGRHHLHILLVTSSRGQLLGVLTKSDILKAMNARLLSQGNAGNSRSAEKPARILTEN
jgi:chloride channel protein, CIC family